jgi:hypothetical protein
MKYALLVAAFLVTATTPASAQRAWTFDNRDPGNLTLVAADHRTCLVEKATGHRVCRTRAEWKRIAKRIEKGQPWR